ncbi:MAG: tRNA pseudouridine(38-40) synthase TruA [Erysipelotrichaceae bacterium]|nr:tRNA pseudouridine(38-40) synthase TruA [Erysipelotrichaceae bacterium]
MKYKCTCSYVGTAYEGFQSQPGGNTIQDHIEAALAVIFRSEIRILSASRTDQGVHAFAHVFQFIAEERDPYKLKGSMNALLPPDIRIRKVEPVADDFHCRYMVKEKTYVYLMNLGEYDVFLKDRAYQHRYQVDVEKMREAASFLEGTHDFGSFNTSSYAEHPDQVRTIRKFTIEEKNGRIKMTVTGTGFLRHMVRIMAGTLLEVGRGRKTPEDVLYMLEHPDKTKRRYNIDACGLYLVNIRY